MKKPYQLHRNLLSSKVVDQGSPLPQMQLFQIFGGSHAAVQTIILDRKSLPFISIAMPLRSEKSAFSLSNCLGNIG